MRKTLVTTMEEVSETLEGRGGVRVRRIGSGGVRLTIQDTWRTLLDSFRPSRNPWRMTNSQLVIV